jgi:dissimilatory sulfite reductase (desulfoviridin) alpha/beta subunit
MLAKGQGFLPLKDKIHFAARVLIPAGLMTVRYAQKLIDIAEKYGRGYFALTQRLDVEIPWIKYKEIELVKEELRQAGLEAGGTGLRIRPIHTCKGTVCSVGLFDTEKAALDMHERFYKRYYTTKFPNKLRLGIAGCLNGCSKPQLDCIGIVGKKVDQVAIFIGGAFARNRKVFGQELAGLYTLPEAFDVIERGVRFYLENGQAGERFAAMVERVGFETVGKAMLKSSI